MYDIVVFGATGFTGGLTADYLAKHAKAAKIKWAIAGRNPAKLENVKQRLQQLDVANKEVGTIQADINDFASLKAMAEQAKVVITTVGPYLEYGEPLVKACVEAGTHYVDLTGEPEFVEEMMVKYHDAAQQKKIKIVNSCGFDSIPHDLGALFTVHAVNDILPEDKKGSTPITVEGFVQAGGTFSGGTWHSAVTQFSRGREYMKKRKQWRSALHAIQWGKHDSNARKVSALPMKIERKNAFDAWAVPFPTIDPQVVRRTAKLNDEYGPDFKYGHYVLVKKLPKAIAGIAGVGGIMLGAQLKWTREQLFKIKDPGQGPSEREMEKGWFRVRFIGSANGLHAWTEVRGGDPGYGETSKMLAESAICLVKDSKKSPQNYGVVTPGAAMGDALIERLQKAGIEFVRLN